MFYSNSQQDVLYVKTDLHWTQLESTDLNLYKIYNHKCIFSLEYVIVQ